MAANQLLPDRVVVKHPHGAFTMQTGVAQAGDRVDLVAQLVWSTGGYEGPLPTVTSCLAQFSAASGAVVVGANSGYYVMLIAQNCSGRVVAFEPFPAARSRLIANLAENGLTKQVDVRSHAVSDEAGGAELHVPVPRESDVHLEGSASLDATFKDGPASAVPVDVIRLDDAHIDDVGLLFVDAEGMDVHVLRGAVELLREHRPFVVVEITDAEVDALTELLSGVSYAAFELTDTVLRRQYVLTAPNGAGAVNHSSTRSLFWSLVLAPVERVADMRFALAGAEIPVEVGEPCPPVS